MKRWRPLLIATTVILAAGPASAAWGGGDKKSEEEKIEKAFEDWAEAYGERMAVRWENWAEDFARRMEARSLGTEKAFEDWATEVEKQWEDWGESYGRRWEAWGEQMESLGKDGNVDIGLVIQGFIENLEGLQHMPLHTLERLPLHTLPMPEDGDFDDLGELIARSIEESLSGLEELESLGDRAAADQIREILEATSSLRRAQEKKRGGVDAASDVQWRVLEEVLGEVLPEVLQQVEEAAGRTDRSGLPGRARKEKAEREKKGRSSGPDLTELRRRIAEIRGEKKGEKVYVDRLHSEGEELEERDRQIETLRREIEELRREIDRLKKDDKRRQVR